MVLLLIQLMAPDLFLFLDSFIIKSLDAEILNNDTVTDTINDT